MLQKLMDHDHSSVHTLSTLPCTERMVCHFMLNANEKHFQGYQAFSAGVLRNEVTFNLELRRGSIYTQSAEQALYFILRFGRKSIDKLHVQKPLCTLWASTTSCSSCCPGLQACCRAAVLAPLTRGQKVFCSDHTRAKSAFGSGRGVCNPVDQPTAFFFFNLTDPIDFNATINTAVGYYRVRIIETSLETVLELRSGGEAWKKKIISLSFFPVQPRLKTQVSRGLLV